MFDAQLPLFAPKFHQPIGKFGDAGRPKNAVRDIAALMERRHQQLVEVNKVVGMHVGDEQSIDRGAAGAGFQQPLGDARSHIDEERLFAGPDQISGAVTVGIGDRAAGAQKRYVHGVPLHLQ